MFKIYGISFFVNRELVMGMNIIRIRIDHLYSYNLLIVFGRLLNSFLVLSSLTSIFSSRYWITSIRADLEHFCATGGFRCSEFFKNWKITKADQSRLK